MSQYTVYNMGGTHQITIKTSFDINHIKLYITCYNVINLKYLTIPDKVNDLCDVRGYLTENTVVDCCDHK
jgi:hypothetical protein